MKRLNDFNQLNQLYKEHFNYKPYTRILHLALRTYGFIRLREGTYALNTYMKNNYKLTLLEDTITLEHKLSHITPKKFKHIDEDNLYDLDVYFLEAMSFIVKYLEGIVTLKKLTNLNPNNVEDSTDIITQFTNIPNDMVSVILDRVKSPLFLPDVSSIEVVNKQLTNLTKDIITESTKYWYNLIGDMQDNPGFKEEFSYYCKKVKT